jgi:hypothetical protein
MEKGIDGEFDRKEEKLNETEWHMWVNE